MSLNSIFENGVVDYVRSLIGLDGNVYPVSRVMLYRMGDMYYFGNGCNLFVGLRKEVHTKTEDSLGMDLFSYNDCKTMDYFKFVSSIRDNSLRRSFGKSRGIYGFLNDDCLRGFLYWSGKSSQFYMNYVKDLTDIIGLWSYEVLLKVFGGIGFLYSGYGEYVVNVEEMEYEGERWIKVSSLHFVVCVRLKRFRMYDQVSFDKYLCRVGNLDLEHFRKKDNVFRGLRVNA